MSPESCDNWELGGPCQGACSTNRPEFYNCAHYLVMPTICVHAIWPAQIKNKEETRYQGAQGKEHILNSHALRQKTETQTCRQMRFSLHLRTISSCLQHSCGETKADIPVEPVCPGPPLAPDQHSTRNRSAGHAKGKCMSCATLWKLLITGVNSTGKIGRISHGCNYCIA